MLCSKCYQEIELGKEIQLEGSIICKECAAYGLKGKEVIARCNQCLKLIYKDEIAHEVYENWGAENSEKLIKCQLCYEEWLETANLKRNYWQWTSWVDKNSQFSMWLVLATITTSGSESSTKYFASAVSWLFFTYNVLLNPFIFNFILFVYQKLRERTIIKEQKGLYKAAIQAVKNHWKRNQSESGEINKLTINEVLGKNWEITLKNKKTKHVSTEVNRLIKKIDDTKLAK